MFERFLNVTYGPGEQSVRVQKLWRNGMKRIQMTVVLQLTTFCICKPNNRSKQSRESEFVVGARRGSVGR